MDITVGGVYLGVWLVEARRSLSSPLVIEGASWAKGRLKFFSTSDPRRPSANEELSQQLEFNGIIELEFTPEVLLLKLLVQHVWKEETKEIFMPDFQIATIADLKHEIDKKFTDSCGVSCLIMSERVLNEDKTMR